MGSRIRVRLVLEQASRDELLALLEHALKKAGNPQLMTPELRETLVDHAAGNYRVLMNMSAELLLAALSSEAEQLDEKLYLETFQAPSARGESSRARKRSRVR